jgi:hypothetical protein
LSGLFADDAHWRNLFGLSWQFATFSDDDTLGHEILRSAREQFEADGLRLKDGSALQAELFVLATGYKGIDNLLEKLFGDEVAGRVGRVWGFDETTGELRNMWTRTPQPGLWFTAGAFSQARIYSRYIALQIDAIENGRLSK